MRSRLFFRECGTVIQTRPTWRRWMAAALWPAVGLMSVLSVLAMGAWLDEPDEALAVPAPAELVQMSAFEAGRLAERQATAQRLVLAYRQGYADAAAALERKAQLTGPRAGGVQAAEVRP